MPATIRATPAPARATARPVRAVVVDDEDSLTDLLGMALRYEGWDVRLASDGQKALKVIREFRPDVVVLDVMLPDIDGLTVLSRLRANGDQTPILFLTAKDAVDDRVAGLTVGGDDYVTKPFSLEELVARLRALIRRSNLALGSASESRLQVGDLVLDEESYEVYARRHDRRADRHRVRAAALPDAQPSPGAQPRPDPRPRLELRLRRPLERRRDLHLLPAQEDRHARPRDDPHRARLRLRAQARQLSDRTPSPVDPRHRRAARGGDRDHRRAHGRRAPRVPRAAARRSARERERPVGDRVRRSPVALGGVTQILQRPGQSEGTLVALVRSGVLVARASWMRMASR